MYNQLIQICPSTLERVSFRSLTTIKIGGPARYVCYPSSVEQFVSLVEFCKRENIASFVLGGGSNILVSDSGFDGVVICTKRMNNISLLSPCRVSLDAGVMMGSMAHFCKLEGLSGAECLCGIPGTIGGAVVMNAGAFGGDIAKILESVTFWENGKIVIQKKSQLFFDYRKSIFTNRQNCAILNVVLRLKKNSSQHVQENMLRYIKLRQDTQNVGMPSAGCVFKRVNRQSAAVLIQNCGLKGMRIGDAMVSNVHAGFIVNMGKATSQQVLSLIDKIEQTVYQQYGVKLERELKII